MASKAAFELILELNDKASKGMKKAAKEGGFLKNALSFATGGAILKGMEAIGGAAKDMFTGSIDEAREAKRGMAQLEAVLTSTGGAAGITKKEALDLADSLSAAGGLSTATDDAVLAAENMLLTFTNIKKDTFPGATKAALDMATAMNNGVTPSLEDLQGKSVLVGKALNDPIKGITALTRVGVTFTDEQKNMIKEMVKMGDTAGAQQIILDELNKEFGGSAKAAADASGGMAQLEGKMDNLKQKVGEALLPVMDGFVNFLNTTALPSVEGLAEAFATGDLSKFQAAISTLPGPLQALLTPLGDVAAQAGKFFKALQSGDPEQVLQFWRDLGGPIGFVGENLTKVVLGVTDFFKGMNGEGSTEANAFWTNFNTGVDTASKGLVVAQKEGSNFWNTVLNVQAGETPFEATMREAGEGAQLFGQRIKETQTEGRAIWDQVLGAHPGQSPFETMIAGAASGLQVFKDRVQQSKNEGLEFWTQVLNVPSGETPFETVNKNGTAAVEAFRERTAATQKEGENFWRTIMQVPDGQTPFEFVLQRGSTQVLPAFARSIQDSQTAGLDFWAKVIHVESGETPFEAVLNRANENLINWANSISDYGGQLVNNFVKGVNAVWSKITEIGGRIIEGVKQGIRNAWGAFASWVTGQFTSLVNTVKSALGISSPSRLFAEEIGAPMVQGLRVGFDEEWHTNFAPLVSADFVALYDTSLGESTDPKWQTPGSTIVGGLREGFEEAWGGFDAMVRANLEATWGYAMERAAQIAQMMANANSATGSAPTPGTGVGIGDTSGGHGGGGGGGIGVLDRGGIVTGPRLAALAMDRRPEAVIPLDRLDRWMSGGRGGGGTNIYVTVEAPLLANSKQQAANEIAEILYDRLQGRI